MQENRKVIIVGFQTGENDRFRYEMNELKELARSCDLEVVAEFSQKGEQVYPNHYFGSGKTLELKELLEEKEVDTIVCNDELSPSQLQNIEKVLDCEIIDRTMLILEIFASRARTKEALLQVEISTLQYSLPRLNGAHANLGRQGGGFGLRNRGSGETKLELSRRQIEKRIHKCQMALKELVLERKTQRKRRDGSGLKTVAVVGYTNAGKSTLINQLVNQVEEKKVYVEDKLFATLETRVRHVELVEDYACLITDTVGFVDKLPHYLIKAFRSTLEEVKEADLLLHVVDISNPNYLLQMETTIKTLAEIGVEDIPMIEVYNKIDLMEELYSEIDGKIYLSAQSGEGINTLKVELTKQLYGDYQESKFLFPYEMASTVSRLSDFYPIISTEHKENGIEICLNVPKNIQDKYLNYKV